MMTLKMNAMLNALFSEISENFCSPEKNILQSLIPFLRLWGMFLAGKQKFSEISIFYDNTSHWFP